MEYFQGFFICVIYIRPMSISFPPLHRETLRPGVNLETYRQELAENAARFADDPAAAAQRYQTEMVEISSLQSEGLTKRNVNDAVQDQCTFQEMEALHGQLSSDTSTLYRLLQRNSQLDTEAQSVLRDVSARVQQIAGAESGDFFFQPVSLGGGYGNILEARVVRSDDSKGLLQVFQVSLHDTPGLDDGLMLVSPLTSEQIGWQAKDLYHANRSTPGIYLNQVDQGWQLHKDHFPVR